MARLEYTSPYEQGSVDWQKESVELPALVERLNQMGVRVKRPTLYRWVREGLVPATKVGRYRTSVAAVLGAMRPAEAA